jgi:CheY-like chemotaxis protein
MKGSLTGRSILIVEDEPPIVMDITQALEDSGAELDEHPTVRHASGGARRTVGRRTGSRAR